MGDAEKGICEITKHKVRERESERNKRENLRRDQLKIS